MSDPYAYVAFWAPSLSFAVGSGLCSMPERLLTQMSNGHWGESHVQSTAPGKETRLNAIYSFYLWNLSKILQGFPLTANTAFSLHSYPGHQNP